MNLTKYQKKARSTAIYLNIENTQMIYPALGLIGECGEVAEKIKKLIRDDSGNMSQNRIISIANELGDCCWYLANICCDTNLDLDMMHKMRGAHITHTIRKLMLPQLVFHMNKHATAVAELLETWYYNYDSRINESSRFIGLPLHLSHIIVCIEEIACRCGFTLKDIYIANIEKLAGRKQRGTLNGEGDDR
jgi:NTP pyrophosphatase (non-canonical NTP hydrolase)